METGPGRMATDSVVDRFAPTQILSLQSQRLRCLWDWIRAGEWHGPDCHPPSQPRLSLPVRRTPSRRVVADSDSDTVTGARGQRRGVAVANRINRTRRYSAVGVALAAQA